LKEKVMPPVEVEFMKSEIPFGKEFLPQMSLPLPMDGFP